MRKFELFPPLVALLLLSPPADLTAAEPAAPVDLEGQVLAAEQAFADAFARRDADAFAALIAQDAVFLGSETPLRGRRAILEVWTGRYFGGEQPPFSWRPGRVAVSAAGDLAMSTGPVFDPEGAWIGAFASTWRRDPGGAWKIVLDVAPSCRPPE